MDDVHNVIRHLIEHLIQIQRGGDRFGQRGQRRQLLKFMAEARVKLCVVDRQPRLRRENGEQPQVFVSEERRGGPAADAEHTLHRAVLVLHGHAD